MYGIINAFSTYTDILQFLKANISFNIRLKELKAFTNELKNTSTLREFTGYAALTDLRGFFSEHSKNNDKRKTVWGILIFNIFFVVFFFSWRPFTQYVLYIFSYSNFRCGYLHVDNHSTYRKRLTHSCRYDAL